MSEKHTCCARVYHQASWRGHPCGRKAKVEREGRWYCGVHDPERLAAIRRKSDEKRAAIRECGNALAARQHRLTAAREAVVEAAKEWHARPQLVGLDSESETRSAVMVQAALMRDLDAAVARLLEVESEHG